MAPYCYQIYDIALLFSLRQQNKFSEIFTGRPILISTHRETTHLARANARTKNLEQLFSEPKQNLLWGFNLGITSQIFYKVFKCHSHELDFAMDGQLVRWLLTKLFSPRNSLFSAFVEAFDEAIVGVGQEMFSVLFDVASDGWV